MWRCALSNNRITILDCDKRWWAKIPMFPSAFQRRCIPKCWDVSFSVAESKKLSIFVQLKSLKFPTAVRPTLKISCSDCHESLSCNGNIFTATSSNLNCARQTAPKRPRAFCSIKWIGLGLFNVNDELDMSGSFYKTKSVRQLDWTAEWKMFSCSQLFTVGTSLNIAAFRLRYRKKPTTDARTMTPAQHATITIIKFSFGLSDGGAGMTTSEVNWIEFSVSSIRFMSIVNQSTIYLQVLLALVATARIRILCYTCCRDNNRSRGCFSVGVNW